MPTYDYECQSCGHTFEMFQSMKDKPLTRCPKCPKGKVKRLIGPGAGIIFKGSGFYETDYKNGRSKEKSTEKAPAKSEGASTSEGAAKAESGSKSESSGKKKPDGGKAA